MDATKLEAAAKRIKESSPEVPYWLVEYESDAEALADGVTALLADLRAAREALRKIADAKWEDSIHASARHHVNWMREQARAALKEGEDVV